MKKLIIALSVLMILASMGIARAEFSSSSMSGKTYLDSQVFVEMLNNTGSPISSNNIVILDVTGGTAGTTLGSYFTTSTTAGSSLIVGVTDENIATGAVGRICVKGPHRLQLTTATGNLAGNRITNGTTAGMGTAAVVTGAGYGYVGVMMGATSLTASTDSLGGQDIWWVYVRPLTE